MAKLLLIRHGQASYGQADYDRLSPRGEEQARALGTHLRGTRIDALYVGPLRRQLETAARAAETAGDSLPAPTQIAELAEYPAFELVTRLLPRLIAEDARFAQLATGASRELANEAFQTIMRRWSHDEWHVDGIERVGEFAARVRRGLERIVGELNSGANVAVVTSAGPIGVAVGLVFAASALHMVRTSAVIRNASITELLVRTHEFAWHPEQVSLLGFNSLAHLPAELHTEY
ncbi:MAG TPA: histidine phosphatase family protein [Kofleriaceae bacterium]|nr:histidine phosphatase family protein [Kofleriaceae bacterium]